MCVIDDQAEGSGGGAEILSIPMELTAWSRERGDGGRRLA